MGGRAKVLLPLAGRPVIAYSLNAFQAAESIAQIILVCSREAISEFSTLLETGDWQKTIQLVTGGDRRQDSVAAGMALVRESCTVVVVHDGARPFASPALVDACVAAARLHGAAIAATPVVDTLKRVVDGLAQATVNRGGLWGAQTPQAVQTAVLREAFVYATERNIEVTDEAMLMEAIGQCVAIVEGSRFNIKITHPGDLLVAEAFARFLEDTP